MRWFAVGLALALAACRPVDPGPDDGRGRTVVLLTVDTLRRDHVGAFPDAALPDATPALDALIAGSTRFDEAVAPAPLTLPSHAAMLSGVAPWESGVVLNGRPVPERPGVVEALVAGGFRSAAFVSSRALDRSLGLDRGFHTWDQPEDPARPGRATVDAALAWLARQPPSASLFLWVHLYDPHEPYEAPPGPAAATLGHPCDWSAHPAAILRGGARVMSPARLPLPAEPACRAADWSGLVPRLAGYAAEVAEADRQVGRLVAGLREGGRWDGAGVVFAADHGEDLVEHQALPGHQFWLSEPVVRVPLAVRDPACADCAGAIRRDQVDLVQVAATLAHLAGVPYEAGAGSLHAPGPSRVVSVGPSPTWVPGVVGAPLQASARYHRHKVVVDEAGLVQRYRLSGDPTEREPWLSAAESTTLRERVDATARAWAEGRPGPGAQSVAPPRTLPPEVRAALDQAGVVGVVHIDDELVLFRAAELRAREALAAARRAVDARGEVAPTEAAMLAELGYAE